MTETGERGDHTDSPLEAAAGDDGSRAAEAFAILGNETRLAILLALWDAYDPFAIENAVSFTELRDQVNIPQGGQFSYHLNQLVGHFIRKTDAGYELRRAGLHLVQTVIAGTGIQDPVLDPTEIDQDCYLCGAPTIVTYRDEMLFWACTECDGKKGLADGPKGLLAAGEFDPAGFAGRSPKEMLNAAWTGGLLNFGLGGVCDACWGPMDGWLHLCDDHASEGLCPSCGFQESVVARFRCSVCKRHHQMVPWWLVIDHPAVVAFYYDHGVPLQYEDGIHFQPRIELHLQAHHSQELISTDPPLVRVRIQYEGDELRLTLDEELNVIDVSERT
ncbi:winged helix-turn-helix domain-containing protein [Halorussus halophilus]|uniref:winged helix-turn-helix domain-containing protein n=1 Tax=Halorussus halophilus TaxID=2650975 RepID=UPI001300D134|nr:winged helix-turn-helix domain-containing protein [Halorussus halophilus]